MTQQTSSQFLALMQSLSTTLGKFLTYCAIPKQLPLFVSPIHQLLIANVILDNCVALTRKEILLLIIPKHPWN